MTCETQYDEVKDVMYFYSFECPNVMIIFFGVNQL